MQLIDEIPNALKELTVQALAWINHLEGTEFELTGVVDLDVALKAAPGETFEIGLVLCDGEICAREQIRVVPQSDHFSFSRVNSAPLEIPALLDPPEGLRQSWLNEALAKYEFVVLLFYRGLW